MYWAFWCWLVGGWVLLGSGLGNFLAVLPDESFVFFEEGGSGFAVTGFHGREVFGDGVARGVAVRLYDRDDLRGVEAEAALEAGEGFALGIELGLDGRDFGLKSGELGAEGFALGEDGVVFSQNGVGGGELGDRSGGLLGGWLEDFLGGFFGEDFGGGAPRRVARRGRIR